MNRYGLNLFSLIFQILLCVILVWSGSAASHVLPVMIGNVVCGVFIWVTSGIDKWKVSFIAPLKLIIEKGDHFFGTITLSFLIIINGYF